MELWQIRPAHVLALALMCALPHCLPAMSTFRMNPPVDLQGNVQVGYAGHAGTVSGAGKTTREEEDQVELPIPESPEEEREPVDESDEESVSSSTSPESVPPATSDEPLIMDGPAEGWVGNGGPPNAPSTGETGPVLMDGPAGSWNGYEGPSDTPPALPAEGCVGNGGSPEAPPATTMEPEVLDGPAEDWVNDPEESPDDSEETTEEPKVETKRDDDEDEDKDETLNAQTANATEKPMLMDGPADQWVGQGGSPKAPPTPQIMDGPPDLWFGRSSTPSPPPPGATDAPLGMDGPGDQRVQTGNPDFVSPPAPTGEPLMMDGPPDQWFGIPPTLSPAGAAAGYPGGEQSSGDLQSGQMGGGANVPSTVYFRVPPSPSNPGGRWRLVEAEVYVQELAFLSQQQTALQAAVSQCAARLGLSQDSQPTRRQTWDPEEEGEEVEEKGDEEFPSGQSSWRRVSIVDLPPQLFQLEAYLRRSIPSLRFALASCLFLERVGAGGQQTSSGFGAMNNATAGGDNSTSTSGNTGSGDAPTSSGPSSPSPTSQSTTAATTTTPTTTSPTTTIPTTTTAATTTTKSSKRSLGGRD